MDTRTHSFRTLSITAGTLLVLLTGCATGREWNVSGGDRDAGVVRVSYEYPEFEEPALTAQQAAEIAAHRCDQWGYDAARPIAGQLRQCSNMDGANCDLWRVTRAYQCTREMAAQGAGENGGADLSAANKLAR
jgi:hypothetical protein